MIKYVTMKTINFIKSNGFSMDEVPERKEIVYEKILLHIRVNAYFFNCM